MDSLQSLSKYGHDFQIKVISSLLTHKKFLVNINDIISPDDFGSDASKWIVKEILKYYNKYNTTPDMEVLKVELQKIPNDVLQISVRDQLKKAYIASEDDLEYVQEEFLNFCKNQKLKDALMTSIDLLKSGKFDSVRDKIDNALKLGQDKNLGHEYLKDLEDRYREESRITIPTPWGEINTILQGGLGTGDFGLLFGNPGGGKSWGLVALGGYAVKLGYTVLHYTLELGEGYVGKRYDAFFSDVPVNKIHKDTKNLKNTLKELKGELVIKEYPINRATLSTLEAHIDKCKNMNINPDLIIIDYVDLLSPGRKNDDRKAEIDNIYSGTKGLARHLQVPIWSVSQVNRSGAQENIIEGDKAAGSYDKISIADFASSLSRKRKDKTQGTGRLHIIKNRYGDDGITFYMKTDVSTGHFKILKEYDEDDHEQETLEPPNKSLAPGNGVDEFDKRALREKFFELNP